MSEPSILERVLRPVLIAVTALMVASVGFQVIARYAFDAPPVWTGESSALALVYLTFLGSGLVAERRAGFRITFLRDRYVHGRAGRAVSAGIRWLEIGLLLLLVVLGIRMTVDLAAQNAVALGISVAWFALAVPVGLAGMAIGLVRAR